MQALHEQELKQVRTFYEEHLHDEVEQAKHDIVKALEEQIQVYTAYFTEVCFLELFLFVTPFPILICSYLSIFWCNF